MPKSKLRQELGEEAWAERRRQQNREKAKRYYKRHGRQKAYDCTSYRIRTKLKLIEYKGGKCERCGYDKPIHSAYAFHHREPDSKDFTVSNWQHCNYKRLLDEVDKCDMLCMNCHAEVHFEEHRWRQQEALENYNKHLLKEIQCLHCKTHFKPTNGRQKFCSVECSNKNKHKCKHPTKEQLQKDIDSMSMLAVGKKYGVSDNAVRKWAKKYGIDCRKYKRKRG